MKIGFIYKITNPNGLIYIGKTSNIKRRFDAYKNLSCSKQPALYNSLIKHGYANHIFEVIDEVPLENLNVREIFWINEYNSYYNGLNCTAGGDGGSAFAGHKHSAISKQKMSNVAKINYKSGKRKPSGLGKSPSNKGSKHTKEILSIISKANKGKIPWNKGIECDINTKKKISGSKKGQKASDDTKLKMSKSRTGKKYNVLLKICPNCGINGKGGNMTRYHFDNCKNKINLSLMENII